MGYYDALRLILNLGGIRYYIDGLPNENEVFDGVNRLVEKDMMVLRSIWPSKLTSPIRYLYEVVLKELAKELDLVADWSLEELYAGVVEYYMRKAQSTRFKTYEFNALIKDLLEWLHGYKKEQPYEIALEMVLKCKTFD